MNDDPSAPDATKDGTAAVAWIRGFRRGVTNDPPRNCPDLPYFGAEDNGSYMDGARLGALVRTGEPIDRSSTLIVTGYPDGTPVVAVPDGYDYDPLKFRQQGVTPLRCAIGSGNWKIYILTNPPPAPDACPFVYAYAEPNSQVTIYNGTISALSGVGPFKETP